MALVVLVAAALGALVPAASAAPANDKIKNRTPLTGPLPIAVSESNAGATREHYGEFRGAAAGHSIWWGWEASMTGWATVSTCTSSFETISEVFEEDEYGDLVNTGDGNGDQGHGCYSLSTTHTFKAQQGHHYVIGADGSQSGGAAPEEGTVNLTIAATPPPPNDQFESPIAIPTPTGNLGPNPFIEPDGPRWEISDVDGYDWGATAQPGEPEYGAPGGASVWYSWTPVRTAEARFRLEGTVKPSVLALYRGSSLGALNLQALGWATTVPYTELRVEVIAGTEYRISVDGERPTPTAEPEMGSFRVSVEEAKTSELPPASGGSPAPAATPAPAAPTLKRRHIDAAKRTATFRFASATAGVEYSCQLDKHAARTCSSPFTARNLTRGAHRFAVRAFVPPGLTSGMTITHFKLPTGAPRPHGAG